MRRSRPRAFSNWPKETLLKISGGRIWTQTGRAECLIHPKGLASQMPRALLNRVLGPAALAWLLGSQQGLGREHLRVNPETIGCSGHTRTRAHTHTCTHTHVHTHTHERTRTHTHTHARTHTHVHARTCAHTPAHTHTHTPKYTFLPLCPCLTGGATTLQIPADSRGQLPGALQAAHPGAICCPPLSPCLPGSQACWLPAESTLSLVFGFLPG